MSMSVRRELDDVCVPAAPQSRLGGDLCSGLPWLPPEHFEAPQGMLSRPPGCKYPRQCALARMCLQAKQKEQAAHKRHERILKAEGPAPELRPVHVSRKMFESERSIIEVIEEAVEEEFGGTES